VIVIPQSGRYQVTPQRRLRDEAFSRVPRLRAGLFCDLSPGEFCPLRIPPFGMAAVSPGDKSRKDGALSPVTSEKASFLSLMIQHIQTLLDSGS